MTDIAKRILETKEVRGIKDHQLEVGADLPPASTRAWRNGRKNAKGEIKEINPSAESIVKVARFLNVSADYLLCLTDEPKPLENHEVGEISDDTPIVFGEMSDLLTDNQFIDSAKLYRAFPDEKKERVYAYILGIATGLGLPLNQILGRK